MRKEYVSYLVCPVTKRKLYLSEEKTDGKNLIKEGLLTEPVSGNKYPIVNYIPRFVSKENYASSFGFQWNTHWQTQQDNYTNVNVSGKRFFEETKWGNDLKNEIILEAGCGAGRFTRHACSTGALVISFDYSNAVEANYKVNGELTNLLLIQADIFNMPFSDNFFDKVFCFGVLQHTPDPKKAFFSIINVLKPTGKIATDIYLKSWKNFFHIKPYVRPLVKNIAPEKLYALTKKYVNFVWPIARLMRKSNIGRIFISRFIAERSDQLGNVEDKLIKEWCYLDTFDWFSPAFDKPQTLHQFKAWHIEAGLENIDVRYGFNGVEGRGTK